MLARVALRCPNCREVLSSDSNVEGEHSCVACGFSFIVDDLATTSFNQRRRIDRFDLLELVGEGAFGVVWKARDPELNRVVALKVPRARHLDTMQAEAFLREARASGQLRHPNIVSVHEVRHEDAQVFIVSDFIDGQTLSRWMDRTRPTCLEAARLVHCLALALHHAHERGIVHRDLKPSNILIDKEGTPFIGDFGLAKWSDEGVTVTVEGQIIGTPAYMSPEQARGKGCYADARADVYSLGVILYELLSNERPFRGSFAMILQQVIHDDPPSLRHLNHRIPRDLETICLKCMEKDPQRRYSSAAALADDLERFMTGESINARPAHMAEKVWRWYRRNPSAATVIAGALSIAYALIMLAWSSFGVVVFALGIHPSEGRWQAVLELVAVMVLFNLPWLFLGIRTINGSAAALWAGTVLSLSSIGLLMLMMAGGGPLLALQPMQEAQSSVYIRVQLAGLLLFIAFGLLIAHLCALAIKYGQRWSLDRLS